MPNLSLIPGPMVKQATPLAAVGRAAVKVLPKFLTGAGKTTGKAPLLSRMGQGLSRFGQRTLYSTTGYLPKMPKSTTGKVKKLQDIGFHKGRSKPELEAAYAGEQGWWARPFRRKFLKGSETSKQRWVAKELERGKAQKKVLEEGYASLPGVVKGLATRPGDVMKKTWQAATPTEKVMAGGFTGMGVHDVVRERKPGDESRGTGLGRLAASSGLWFPLTGLSVAPQMASWIGAEALGARAGKGISRLVSGPNAPTPAVRTPTAKPPIMRQPLPRANISIPPKLGR